MKKKGLIGLHLSCFCSPQQFFDDDIWDIMPAFRGHWFCEFLPIAQCGLRASLKANRICNAGTCHWRHTKGQRVAVSIEGSDSDSASERAIRLTQQVKRSTVEILSIFEVLVNIKIL